MKKYRCAIVGCGRIASLFAQDKKRKGVVTHAQAYLDDPRTELVAACDLDRPRLEDFGKQWGVQKLYTDLKVMLKKERPDILSICTWNSSHRAITELALKHGVRGILCEKPIADSLDNARKMVRACAARRVPLLINYTRRYLPLFHRLKQQIDRGALGSIQGVSAYYTAGAINTGTHLFDFLRYFFGGVEWVWADPDRVLGDQDKTYSGYLYFKRKFGCTLTALDVKSYLMFEADIYGTQGRLRITDSGAKAKFWKVVPHEEFSGYYALKEKKTLSGGFSMGLPNLLTGLIDAIEKRSPAVCSGSDGTASLEIAAALRSSAEQGGKKIRLPLKNGSIKLTSR